jgi:hypothetical protein
MGWVRVDDQFFRHPKARSAGKDGRLLFVTGLAYCTSNLTDGLIHRDALPLVAAEAEVRTAVARRLVEVGLWEEVEGGFQVHDYLDYQPSAEKVRAEKSAAKERMRGKRSPERPPPTDRSSPEHPPNFGGSSPSPSHPIPEVPNGTSLGSPNGAQPQTPKKRATQLPKGWMPNDSHRSRASQLGVGDLDHQADQFKNHHEAKGSVFKSWDAAFHTWIGNAPKFAGSLRAIEGGRDSDDPDERLAAYGVTRAREPKAGWMNG